MGTVTLERIHEDLLELKQEVNELKRCFHEDFLELSSETKRDVEEARKRIKQGKFVRHEEVLKEFGLE